jgi:hypothetical protein
LSAITSTLGASCLSGFAANQSMEDEMSIEDKGGLTDRPYVMTDKRGLRYIGLHTSEEDCWRVALGWPSDDEIEWHKAQGVRVYPATVTWKEQ